jgi:hypothetical protein
MKAVIREHVSPGQRALVVCKKELFLQRNVPDWDRRDPRFDQPAAFTKDYGWDIEGRKLCAIHWGTGIGENWWHEAEVVLLFHEFDKPIRSSIARAQGLMGSKATEGALGSMKILNSRAPQVNTIREGDLLRWTKQMALRGKRKALRRARCVWIPEARIHRGLWAPLSQRAAALPRRNKHHQSRRHGHHLCREVHRTAEPLRLTEHHSHEVDR